MTSSQTDLHARFGELRSAIHSLTGDERWARLVALLDDWPQDHLQDAVIPYLQDTLQDDTCLREAPEHWYTLGEESFNVHHAFALVRSLSLPLHKLNAQQLEALANSPSIEHLTRLALNGNQISAEGVHIIVNSPHLTHLTQLDLHGNAIGNEGAIALASSPYLPKHIRDQWTGR